MFARRLAHQSGLEYAMLAGGDVGPLGNDASAEIHKVCVYMSVYMCVCVCV